MNSTKVVAAAGAVHAENNRAFKFKLTEVARGNHEAGVNVLAQPPWAGSIGTSGFRQQSCRARTVHSAARLPSGSRRLPHTSTLLLVQRWPRAWASVRVTGTASVTTAAVERRRARAISDSESDLWRTVQVVGRGYDRAVSRSGPANGHERNCAGM